MELSKILTEAEMLQLTPEMVAKIESAYRSELATAIESDSNKQRKQVEKMLECVMQRAETMIGEAVAENVEKYKSNAINDKMYKVLKAVSACLESAGITISEELAEAKRKRREAEEKLKAVYQELNKAKQAENEANKKDFIRNQVVGMKPDVVQKVVNDFMNPNTDVREINKDTIAKAIAGDDGSSSVFMLDIDPDCDGELNMNNVSNALKEIKHALDMEPKAIKAKTESRFESLGRGLQPQRSTLPSGNITLESLDASCNDDSDVAEAMAQLKDFAGFSAGKFA